jgi:phosphatidylinositol-3-phosphatase
MVQARIRIAVGITTLIAAAALSGFTARANDVKTVFVIAMENHNWTQPAQIDGGIQQIYRNPNAPYINSLVDGTSAISDQVAYANAYHNVLATPSGNNPHIHPSEPNYLWAEAGTNFGVTNDNDPFAANGPTNQNTSAHLSTLLTAAGQTWRSYQEDTDLVRDAAGKLTNVPLPADQYFVPLKSASGTFSAGFNQYYLTPQYNYAAKHNPQVFFTDTNGGNDLTSANPLASHYAPLQQLALDLSSGAVADYNWITPNQFNDMHTGLAGGFQGLTGDAAKIKQGDSFLQQFVPMIMASDAYKNHGVIVLWWDEAEGDGVSGDNADRFDHTIPFIVISQDAAKNVDGVPFGSTQNYSHSSFLRTMQEIFRVGPFLGDAANAEDLADLFKPGSFKTMR